jgi:hypothetical protein
MPRNETAEKEKEKQSEEKLVSSELKSYAEPAVSQERSASIAN